MGKEAIRKGLIEGGGAKMIGLECAASGSAQENASVTVAVLVTSSSQSLMAY